MKRIKKIAAVILIFVLLISTFTNPVLLHANNLLNETNMSGDDELIGLTQEATVVTGSAIVPTVVTGSSITVDPSIIHTIKASKDGIALANIVNYRPLMGDKVRLEIKFTLESGHSYGAGSVLTYTLPAPLKAASGTGSLLDEGQEYATYKVEAGNVVITFNENIRSYDNGLEVHGFFAIEATYSSNATDLKQDLILPDKDEISGFVTIPLYFKPIGGSDIVKSVNPLTGNNTKFVTWTVNVNTVIDNLGIGKEFKDLLITTNHSYEADSLKVIRYLLAPDGKTRTGEFDVTSDFNQLQGTETEFSLNLTGEYAYEISYNTIPKDTEDESQVIKNRARFNGKSVEKSSTIFYGKPLDKTAIKQSDGTTDWTITVNANEKTVLAGTIISDNWSVGHKLKSGSFKINGSTSISPDFEIDLASNQEGFTVKLLNNILNKFEITYTTELVDENNVVSTNIPITNRVVRSDRPLDIKSLTIQYNQNILRKTNSEPNYKNKTIDWTIEINSASYEMDSILLEDIFDNKNLKIVDGTFQVKKGNTLLKESTDYIFTHKDNIIGDKKGGFSLSIPNSTSKNSKIIITYTTEYDIKDLTNPSAQIYSNSGVLRWYTNGKLYSSTIITKTVDVNNQQKHNGYKEGIYNYENKKFMWQVGINYNYDTIVTPVFVDTLSSSQEVIRESIMIYPLDLSTGGNGSINEQTPLIEGIDYELTNSPLTNTFTITFLYSIHSPYRIMYESVTKYDYYAPNNMNQKHVVENEAVLYNNSTVHSKWEVPGGITVEHSDKLINKLASQVGGSTGTGSAKVNWSLNLNWSQSTLINPIIKDTIGKDSEGNPNQMIYKDSLCIYEVNFNGTNQTPILGRKHLPGTPLEGLYYVTFHEGVSEPTFTITFNQDINKAYVVQYDSYFLGADNTNIENTALLSYGYKSNDQSTQSGAIDDAVYSATFRYYGGASAIKGQLQITKVDKDNPNLRLSGAIFQLWNKASNGILIEEVSSDVNGVYTFLTKVGQGDYYLIETKAPDGYSLEDSEYKSLKKVSIKDIGAIKTPNYVEKVEVANRKIHQSIQLLKLDSTDATLKLEGAEFNLYHYDGTIVTHDKDGLIIPQTYTTNRDGIILIDNLTPGNYKLVEVTAPAGYWLDDTPIHFTISANQLVPISVIVTNTKVGNLIIKKVDNNQPQLPLNGAEFKLYDLVGNEVAQAVTSPSGIAEFNNIKYGTYILKETVAPQGYLLDSKSDIVKGISITINSKLHDLSATPFTNKKIINAFKLSKKDADSLETLNGAVFDLYVKDSSSKEYVIAKDEDGKEIKNLITNDLGEIQVGNLLPGEYRLIESKAPRYYVLDTTPYDFIITNNQTSFSNVTVTNTRGMGEIIITKVDGDDHSILLSDVEFLLTNHDNSINITGTTVNGNLKFSGLPYDTYKITEIKAHKDYILDNVEHIIVLDSSKNLFSKSIVVENTKAKRSVILTKYNESKLLRLENAIFELKQAVYDKDGILDYQVVTNIGKNTLTTNDKGVLYLNDLEIGIYQLIEIVAPNGYLLNKDPIDFEITRDQISILQLEKVNYRTPIVIPVEPNIPIIPEKPEVLPPTTPELPQIPNEPEEAEVDTPVKPNESDDVAVKEIEVIETIDMKTPKDKSVKTKVNIPEGSSVKVIPPKKGIVTLDEEGELTYTPNEEVVGKDQFTIVVTDSNGLLNQIIVNVLIGESNNENPSMHDNNTLPKTGEARPFLLYFTGFIFIFLGFVLFRGKRIR